MQNPDSKTQVDYYKKLEITCNTEINHNKNLNNIINAVLFKRNVILHSAGGTGKSYLLREVATYFKDCGRKVFVTATTGVAAVNLGDNFTKNSEGDSEEDNICVTTLHQFAGVGMADKSAESLIKYMRPGAKHAWNICEILIIDEVSMLGASLFQKLDIIAKTLRKNCKPFGGIQLIVSGDFLQLPPVKDTWVFLTPEWEALNFRPFILEHPFRYPDVNLFHMLLRIRNGELCENDVKILKGRVKAYLGLQNMLKDIETGKMTDNNGNKYNVGEVIRPTVFYSKRIDVNNYNDRELAKLPGIPITFIARDDIVNIKNPTLPNGKNTVEEYTGILDENLPKNIYFKVGAQVMLKINKDVDAGLVNGSRGVICEITPDEGVTVKFLNGKKVFIELHERKLDNKYITMKRTQVPLILAYAMSIHKCQGCSVDYAIIDVGSSIFEDGQAYVALSRCKTIGGLFISGFLPNSIRANQKAIQYSKKLYTKWIAEDYPIINQWLEFYKLLNFPQKSNNKIIQKKQTELFSIFSEGVWKDIFRIIDKYVRQIAVSHCASTCSQLNLKGLAVTDL